MEERTGLVGSGKFLQRNMVASGCSPQKGKNRHPPSFQVRNLLTRVNSAGSPVVEINGSNTSSERGSVTSLAKNMD